MHYLLLLVIILMGCDSPTELDCDVLTRVDTVFSSDTIEILPVYSYRKVMYDIQNADDLYEVAFTGSDYQLVTEQARTRFTGSLFIKDSLNKSDSVFLEVYRYQGTSKIIAKIHVDEQVRWVDTLFPGDESLKIGGEI